MDILADANLQQNTIVTVLKDRDKHNVYVVTEAGLADPKVGELANNKKALIVTNDVQTFIYENYKINGSIPQAGVLELRLQGLSEQAKAERVSNFIKEKGQDLNGKVAVLEPATERIRNIDTIEADIRHKAELKETKQQRKAETLREKDQKIDFSAKGNASAQVKDGMKNAIETGETITKATVKATEKAVDVGMKVADKTLQTAAQVPLKATSKAVETAVQVAAVPLKAAGKVVETAASVAPTVVKTTIQVAAVPMKAVGTGINAAKKTIEGVKIVGKGIKDELQGKKQEEQVLQPPPPTPKQTR